MYDYEICPTCGATLDIGEKCEFCKPLVTPIPIISEVISKSQEQYTMKEGITHADSQ
jgi:methionyl-tRNA synthetase